MKKTDVSRICVACRCLKTACNHELPCSKCQSAGLECSYSDVATRKTNLHLRDPVTHLEGLLKQIVDKLETDEQGLRNSEPETVKLGGRDGRSFSKDGKSVYIANSVWSHICQEVDMLNETQASIGDVVFGHTRYNPVANTVEIQVLWSIYVKNVDPLNRLLDVPTTQALLDKETPTIEEKALLSACWYAAINSITEQDCLDLIGLGKYEALATYKSRVQQALLNANYIESLSLVAFQAFVIYLLVAPKSALLAMAVHIGQRIGLHKDSATFKLSKQDIDLRQRLWWNLIHMDARACELSGTISTIMPTGEINPSEMETIADKSMCFIQPRTYMLRYYFHLYRNCEAAGDVLHKLENLIEEQLLARLDPLEPLELFTSLTARAFLSSCRVSSMLQVTVQDELYEECLRSIEYDNLKLSTLALQGFSWHARSYFQYHIFVTLLKALKEDKYNHLTARAWTQIEVTYRQRPELRNNDPLHTSIRKLTFQAWDAQGIERKGWMMELSLQPEPHLTWDVNDDFLLPLQDGRNIEWVFSDGFADFG